MEVKEEMQKALEDLGEQLLRENVLQIRDVAAGEKAFLYASGNWGPGYAMVKGLVGNKPFLKALLLRLAVKIADLCPHIDFISANATGGMVPGWIVSDYLEILLQRRVPYIYMRGSRKKGGHKELFTGVEANPSIVPGKNGLVGEELANFADTTCNAAEALRAEGFNVTHGMCILFYNNPKAIERLRATEMEEVYLFTLPQILDIAESRKTHAQHVIDDYRRFLEDPLAWQKKFGLEPVLGGGTQ